MNGNIVGEEIEDFVQDQIKTRQSNQYGGYGTSLRTDDQLQYLNNRNAWIKLASSVDILEGDIITPLTGSTTTSGGSGAGSSGGGFNPSGGYTSGTNFGNTGTGFSQSPTGAIPGLTNIQVKSYKSQKLRDINIENPENYPGSKLAESAILFNTLSSFDPVSKSYASPRAGISNNTNLWNSNFAYGLGGTSYGIQPPPGITGATVDSLNRGSIRKATVTLKAHNKFQFDIIELLYLRLGFTMMLEWGWDRYLDNDTGKIEQVGNTIIEEKWFTSNSISQIEMLRHIQDKRKEYNGNYDGFFGKVSNFTWNFNPDGSYDISIDLITLGDVIESLKVNTFAKGSYISVNNNTSTVTNVIEETIDANTSLGISTTGMIAKAAAVSTIGYYLFEKVKELNSNKAVHRLPGFNKLKDTNDSLLYYKIPSTKIVGQGRGQKTSTVNDGNDQYYVRLGEFLARLESLTIPLVQNGGNTSDAHPQISINYLTEENLISFFPNQISFDPKICIFRPLIAYGDISGINYLDELTDLDLYAEVAVENRTTQVYGSLMSLYVNFEFLSQLIIANGGPNQELSIFKFMQDLCNGINDALGGVNKLEPVVKDDRIVTIIDQTLSRIPPTDITDLEIYGYNPKTQTSNFVKDIKFVSKITPQLASMISIGATAAGSNTSEIDGTAFSKWSEGLIDRFTESILEPDGKPKSDTSTIDEDTLANEFINDFPPAYSAAQRFFMRVIQTGKWAQLKKWEYFKDLKRITNPYYEGIHNQAMDLQKFLTAAIEIIKNKRKQNIYQTNDLPELVNNNYAVYLTYAFGGKLENILIQKSSSTRIRGGGSRGIYAPTEVISPFTFPKESARYLQYNDTFIAQGKGVYKNYLNILNNERYKSENLPSSDVGFIPLSFELVLDGISGIKIYNKLNINNTFLPTNYPQSLKFVITKVNHNISNNSWDTSLSTISIPNTSPYPLNLSNALSTSVNTGNTGGGNTGGGTGQPIPIGPTPNANYLRGILRQLGYTEKGTELSENGDISSELAKVAESVFRMFKQRYPKNSIIVTAGNDAEHKSGSHPKGNGIDFVITGTTKKVRTEQIDADLATMVFLNPGFRFINEYEYPSSKATGPHYHFSWNQANDGNTTSMKIALQYAIDQKLEGKRFILNNIYYIKF